MKPLILLLLLVLCNCCIAQKWAIRGSYSFIQSFNDINVISMESKEGLTNVYHRNFQYGRFRNRLAKYPILTNFMGISAIYSTTTKSSFLIGFQSLEPDISSTIGFMGNTSHGTSVSIPTIKLNYMYVLSQSNKINPSNFSVFTGLVVCFKGKDGTFGNGSWGGTSGGIDSTGDTIITSFVSVQKTGAWRPNYPMPYLNVGIDGNVRLGKRFKIGLELAGYFGYKTLYIEQNKGITNDASFSYEIILRRYFFTGGIYFQYRIK